MRPDLPAVSNRVKRRIDTLERIADYHESRAIAREAQGKPTLIEREEVSALRWAISRILQWAPRWYDDTP